MELIILLGVPLAGGLLLALGKRVGAYTSPHLCRYNERVRVQGSEATDAAICDAFAAIEQARGEIPLTYFEFGTLAALEIPPTSSGPSASS